ncbi:MAG TPA: aminotransferase class V-fold PLP-dependent enzyme, partial [Thermoleophilaceae bacterium]|nr:aminotransferase class V-fold PLP-dependent enzyme [Thermoleophilaceae bacterium]
MTRPRARVFPPLDPRTYARRAQRELPFPLEEERCRIFHLARHGLVRGLTALGLRPGDQVLAPAYHHGSEIEALVRSGLGCRFYEATETLAPDPDELEASLGPRVRALHLIHYLGFPQDAVRWRRWCDERGLLMIEDAAQAWLAGAERPVGSLGDLAIFSLYKTLGVPGGGAVVCAAPLPAPGGRPALHAARLAKAHRSWVALRWPRLAHPRQVRSGPPGGGVGEGEFAVGDPDTPPSMLTRFLLRRLEPAGAPERRRQNYRFLLDRLGGLVPPPFADLPGGASPFAFPVAV